jgi:hypothetical protein
MTHEEMQRHVLSRARLLSERGGYTQNVLRSINNYPSLDTSPPASPSSSSWKQQSTIADDIEAGHVRNHLPISNKQVSLLSSELAANKDSIGEKALVSHVIIIITVSNVIIFSYRLRRVSTELPQLRGATIRRRGGRGRGGREDCELSSFSFFSHEEGVLP